ncbi:MAG: glycosyltransferase family protein [Candidatus Mucispirillum faecigallinarum]|nr:glycosyltransferase family protein [Candidatus Mucispirillum faecigallinarum]
MKKVIIIQARMGSSRLKGKVLFDLCGKPMLLHIYKRLSLIKCVDDIIVATTVKSEDDAVADICEKNNISYFRGSVDNVLERFYQCGLHYKADIITRITADCPLIVPSMIEQNINIFLQNKYDCISPRSKDGLIRGLDNETFSFKTLSEIREKNPTDSEKEHVTLYIYNHENDYKILSPKVDEIYKSKNIRLCVDEEADFKLIEHVYNKFYQENSIINTRQVIEYLLQHSEINNINKDIKQKEV